MPLNGPRGQDQRLGDFPSGPTVGQLREDGHLACRQQIESAAWSSTRRGDREGQVPDQGASEPPWHRELTIDDTPYRTSQRFRREVLGQISGGAKAQCLMHVLDGRRHSEHDDVCMRQAQGESSDEVDAAAVRQIDVDEDDVGARFDCNLLRFRHSRDVGHDFDVGSR